MKLAYLINSNEIILDVPDNQKFFRGKEICLSKEFDDLVIGTKFQEQGFDVINFDNILSFSNIKHAVFKTIKENIINLYPQKNLTNFTLKK